MDTALLQDLAQQVIKDGILLNWRFYLILILIQSASALLMDIAKRYFGKRSETAATKADFEEILRQLRTSTQTTEEIKTTLAHKDWSVKEYKTLRRTKLEKLMSAVFEVDQSTNLLTSFALLDAPLEDIQPVHNKIRLISKLYFPELYPATEQLFFAHNAMLSWAINERKTLQQLNPGSPQYEEIQSQALPLSRNHSLAVSSAVRVVEKHAEGLMKEIIDYH